MLSFMRPSMALSRPTKSISSMGSPTKRFGNVASAPPAQGGNPNNVLDFRFPETSAHLVTAGVL